MKINEKLTIELTEDLHGFPTYAVHYRHTRYNFCHLADVCAFQHKVFHVDNDELLAPQRKHKVNSAAKVATVAKRKIHNRLREFILTILSPGTTITHAEVQDYVNMEFGAQFHYKQVANSLTYLIAKGEVLCVGRGQYRKMCADGVPRELHGDDEKEGEVR